MRDFSSRAINERPDRVFPRFHEQTDRYDTELQRHTSLSAYRAVYLPQTTSYSSLFMLPASHGITSKTNRANPPTALSD